MEHLPVALWEQDFQPVLDYLDTLGCSGITDLGVFFEKHPEQVAECARRIRVVNVNPAAVALYEADTASQLSHDLAGTFSARSYEVFRDILVTVAKGGTRYESELRLNTLAGNVRDVLLQFSLVRERVAGQETATALIALTDISDRKHAEKSLRDFIQFSRVADADADPLEAMALQMASSLQADALLIGEILDERPGHVVSVALVVNGRLGDAVEYALVGTPCENVVGKVSCSYPRAVQAKFPEDAMLEKLGAEAYVGVPLCQAGGRPLGVVVALFRAPLDNAASVEASLDVFSSQVAYEVVRRRNRKQLRQSEARYRELVDSTPMCIQELGLDGVVRSINRFGRELLGVERAGEVTGTDFLSLVAEEHRERIAGEFARAAEGQSGGGEFSGAGKAAGCEFSINFNPVLDREGRIELVLAVSEEITSRKEAESALKSSRERLRALVDALPNPVWLKDANRRFLACNRAFERYIGKTQAEVLGKTSHGLVPPEVASISDRLDAEALRTGEVQAAEIEMTHKQKGDYAWFELTKVPILHSGESPSSILSIAHDITERRRYEKFVDLQSAVAEAVIELPEEAGRLDEAAFIQRGLDVLEELSDCRASFAHVADDETGALFSRAVSGQARELPAGCLEALRSPAWDQEPWAAYLLNRSATIVSADDCPEGIRKGFEGDCHLALLPIVESERTCAVFVLAGRENEFTRPEVEILQMFINALWRIVQRHRAEADASRYSWVLEKSLHEIYLVNIRSLHIQHANESARENLGYSNEELRNMTPLDLMPRFRETSFAALIEHVRDGESLEATFTTVHRRKDGSVYPVEVNLQLIEQSPDLVVAMVRDIGEHMQMEQELLKLALAVEQSPVSILITNALGETEYVNESFIRTTGFTREEVVGQNPDNLTPVAPGKGGDPLVWDTLKSGRTWEGEAKYRCKDGSEVIERERITPIRQADGAITHYLSIREDITEKTRLWQELQSHRDHLEELVHERTQQLEEARQRAELAGQVKSQFLANMSHEIRTPMNAVLGLIYLLQRSDLDPSQQKKLAQIKASTEHLLGVISDILDLSKIEAGKLSLESLDFHVSELFDHVETILVGQAAAKGLGFEREIEDGLPRMLGDRTRLTQILLNYAQNAIKFTEKGEVRLCATREPSDDGELRMRFEVRDTGIGLDLSRHSNIFDAFEQADASTTRAFGGTGLGLAISRHLAELLGGEVGVDSEVGKGSTFWFTARLELAPAEHAEIEPAGKNHALDLLRERHRGARILLVDDNAVNLDVAREVLSQTGLRVETASSAAAAVAKACSRQYDLVLMDIQMPGTDGLEATRRIRMIESHRHTPVLAMTAYSVAEQHAACLAAGMDDFLLKPLEPESLFAKLVKWLPTRDKRRPGPGNPPAESGEGPAGALDVTEAGSHSHPIDLRALTGLLGGDPVKHRTILRKFVTQTGTIVADTRVAAEARDASRVQFLSHKLKSSAGTVGAHRLAIICRSLELAGQDGDWQRIDPLVRELLNEFRETREHIARL